MGPAYASPGGLTRNAAGLISQRLRVRIPSGLRLPRACESPGHVEWPGLPYCLTPAKHRCDKPYSQHGELDGDYEWRHEEGVQDE
jgi:hypothetical protein